MPLLFQRDHRPQPRVVTTHALLLFNSNAAPVPRGQADGAPGVGVLTGVNQVLGHFAELDVEVLGSSTQYVERLVRGDPLSLHENPHRLADDLAAGQGGVEVVGPPFLGLVGVGNGECQASHCCQEVRSRSVENAEDARVTGLEVEGPEL